jgi:hypothetical protein
MAIRFLIPLLLAASLAASEGERLQLKGSGWFQFGRITHSSDTLSDNFNYNGNWSQNSGAQFTVISDIDANWQGAVGLGGLQIHNAQGADRINARPEHVIKFKPYITEARFSFYLQSKEASPLAFHAGLFPYQYNPDVRNLGAYLLRGPVYPGILISEFESQSLDPTVGNILGAQIRNRIGNAFTQDLLLRSETDLPPVYDFSLAYVASLNLGGVLELGAGVNFYRLIPSNSKITDLEDRAAFSLAFPGAGEHPYMNNYGYRDSVGILPAAQRTTPEDSVLYDTTLLSMRGTKLMGRVAFDPKPWFGASALGPRDLRLYAEAAVIGVRNYGRVYPDIAERIPFVVGFNLPVFRLLDEAAVEVEWYGAPFRDDYQRLLAKSSPVPRNNIEGYAKPRVADSLGFIEGTNIPFGDPYDVTRMKKDDWKWSFYASKTFANCFKLSFQAANDHFRPYTADNSFPYETERFEAAFTTLKDWYFMFRMGFFF